MLLGRRRTALSGQAGEGGHLAGTLSSLTVMSLSVCTTGPGSTCQGELSSRDASVGECWILSPGNGILPTE